MRQNRKNWSRDEDQTIINLVKKFGIKRWTLISEKMKERFPDDGRSGKQCRERWHNHLSPIISKQPWSQEQIKLVFDSHRKYGNKWTEIAQHLSGRTDNAVKNQFYSTLRKGLRRICKILGTRNSTTRIKKIKPTALSNLISNFTQISLENDSNEYQLYDMLFEFSNGDKYEQLKEKQVTEKYKQKMERLLEKILDSKENCKKKKQKSSTKQQNNTFQNLPENNNENKQAVNDIKMESENGMFEFHVNLDEQQHDNNEQEPCFGSDQNQYGDQQDYLMMNDDVDSRLEKPISLKRQNSIHESDKSPSMKKKSSESERNINKRNYELQVENHEHYLKCFMSKSPNFSSRVKMPTPRMHDSHGTLPFFHFEQQPREQDPEKFYNNFIEQTRHRIEKSEKQRRLR